MNTSKSETERELWLDQEAHQLKCPTCGAVLNRDHGMINVSSNPPSGVTWWECDNGHRIKDDYTLDLENNKIISHMEEV